MLGRETVINVDCQVTSFGELHPELAMRLRAASDPSAAVQIDDDRMRPVSLRHRDVSGETGTNLDCLVKRTNLGRIRVHHRRERIHSLAQPHHVGRDRSLGQSVEKSAFLFGKHACTLLLHLR